MKLPQTGGCQCGKIRYEITEAPQLVYTCHCTDCQHITGSAFSLGVALPETAFRCTAGEPRALQRMPESGRLNTRFVCPDCASWVYSLPRGGVIRVRAGTLDDTSWLCPTRHIWQRRLDVSPRHGEQHVVEARGFLDRGRGRTTTELGDFVDEGIWTTPAAQDHFMAPGQRLSPECERDSAGADRAKFHAPSGTPVFTGVASTHRVRPRKRSPVRQVAASFPWRAVSAASDAGPRRPRSESSPTRPATSAR